MLRYKIIDDYLFMDTFFATKKAKNSSCGHTCCQLFVTDRGFVYVVPMKKYLEVLQAVKKFSKEISAPDAIISDASEAQTSDAVFRFLPRDGYLPLHPGGWHPMVKQGQVVHWHYKRSYL